MELWDYERQAWNSGAETVCGVDEAGAGPLMGPVYAAAGIVSLATVFSSSSALTNRKC